MTSSEPQATRKNAGKEEKQLNVPNFITEKIDEISKTDNTADTVMMIMRFLVFDMIIPPYKLLTISLKRSIILGFSIISNLRKTYEDSI